MAAVLPADLLSLGEAFEANARDARALVADLTDGQGGWRPAPGSWTVAECLDHLAIGHRVYLDAMEPAAARARERGRARRGPATPGLFGGLFVRSMEPPARMKVKAPGKITPRPSPSLADASAAFAAAHEQVVAFLGRYADIDLAGVRFPNPFVRGVRFSLATGLHVLAAHERRHLHQAWNVRRAAVARPATPCEAP